MKCKHYKGSGIEYKLKGESIWLCDKCNYTLIQRIFELAKDEQLLIEQKMYDYRQSL